MNRAATQASNKTTMHRVSNQTRARSIYLALTVLGTIRTVKVELHQLWHLPNKQQNKNTASLHKASQFKDFV